MNQLSEEIDAFLQDDAKLVAKSKASDERKRKAEDKKTSMAAFSASYNMAPAPVLAANLPEAEVSQIGPVSMTPFVDLSNDDNLNNAVQVCLY